MDWFNGDVSVGITEAKKRNTLFVVYIRDDSEESKKMDKTWASSEVAEICKKRGLVVMRFQKDSSECKMFSQYYPVLVVPSVSFISGQTGVLVEATAGHVDVAPFLDRIEAAAKAAEGSSTGNSENTKVGETSSQAPTEQTESAPAPTHPPATAAAPTESVQERAARLRKKMEEVHAKKEAQKKETERQKEIERRKVGQAVQKAQQTRAEQEAKQLAYEIKKEKMEDKMAKQKIREQIARDRAEKDAKFAAAKAEKERMMNEKKEADLETKRAEEEAKTAANREIARIQFRMPDGTKILHQFPSSATLREAHQFMAEQIGDTLKEFNMATAFPRKQFGASDMDSTLLSLQLAPSAAIVILPGSGGGRSSSSTAVSSGDSFISMLLAPLVFLWNLFYTFLFGTRVEDPPPREATSSSSVGESSQAHAYQSMGARPKSSYARRRTPASSDSGSISRQEGNIHRLNRDDDNDDENNTWNGNSTQQM